MVSLAVGCSTLFVITVYVSGVESHDADTTIANAKKKQEQPQHDISVYFRPMLGKRGSVFVPRLGKRDLDYDDAPYPSWDTVRSVVTDAELHESDSSKDQPETVQHPLVLRWYTPRLGKRSSFFTPRLGKRMSYFTPRLGKSDTEDNDVLWETEGAPEYDVPKERRGERKEDKVWRVIGMFNPRLGRSVPSDIADYELAREHSKNIVNFNPDRE